MTADARTALLDAAERLFGERGLGSVSLREVGVAAGQRNNSAAQYHFGSREGLVLAVFERRMEPINARRQQLLDDLDATGLGQDRRALTEALVLPLADAVANRPESHYARFLAQGLASEALGAFASAPAAEQPPYTAAYREVRDRLGAGLGHLPKALRPMRVDRAVQLLVHAVASWELVRAAGRPHTPMGLLATDLVDTAVAVLAAPTSIASRRPSPTALELAC